MRGIGDKWGHFGRRFVREEGPICAELLKKVKMVRSREDKQRQHNHRAQVRHGGHTAGQTRGDQCQHTDRHPHDDLEQDVENKRANPTDQELVAEFTPGRHDPNPPQIHDRYDKLNHDPGATPSLSETNRYATGQDHSSPTCRSKFILVIFIGLDRPLWLQVPLTLSSVRRPLYLPF